MRQQPNPFALATPNQNSPAANIAALVLLGSPPDIVINGGFNTDSDWNSPVGSWSIAAGIATSNGTDTFIQQNESNAVAGRVYLTKYTQVANAAGTTTIAVGAAGGTARGAVGTYAEAVTAGFDGTVGVQALSSFADDIDDVFAYDMTSNVNSDGSYQVIDRIDFAYSAAPTGGGIQIIGSTGVLFDLDIVESDPKPLKFGHGARGGFHGLANKPLAVLLKPGGSSITGKLNVISR